MFSRLLKALAAPEPETLGADDARLALSALMVRIARSDHDYALTEQERIEAIVRARFGLGAAEAAALRAEAETLEAEAPDTVRFTRAIKDAIAHEDRAGLLEALWSLVLVDGHRDDHENALMRLVASLLGVNDRDSALARQKAERSG